MSLKPKCYQRCDAKKTKKKKKGKIMEHIQHNTCKNMQFHIYINENYISVKFLIWDLE